MPSRPFSALTLLVGQQVRLPPCFDNPEAVLERLAVPIITVENCTKTETSGICISCTHEVIYWAEFIGLSLFPFISKVSQNVVNGFYEVLGWKSRNSH